MHLWIGVVHCSTWWGLGEKTAKIIARDNLLDGIGNDIPDLDKGPLDRDYVWVVEGYITIRLVV